MGWMTPIVNALNSVSSWFYEVYLDVYGWVYPFYLTAPFFYYLSSLFSNLAWYFNDFGNWINYVANQVAAILSWSTIWSYILSYVPNLLSIRDWFYSWATSVTATVNTWWSTTQTTVLAWVQGAKDFATALFNQLSATLASLQAAWDAFKGKIPSLDAIIAWWGNWWGQVLLQLGTWWAARLLDVQGLIDSAFLSRDGWWAGWQDWRDQVAEFFGNPVEYLWQRFADWFLGPEV